MAEADWSLAEEMTNPEKKSRSANHYTVRQNFPTLYCYGVYFFRFEFGVFQSMTLPKPNVNR